MEGTARTYAIRVTKKYTRMKEIVNIVCHSLNLNKSEDFKTGPLYDNFIYRELCWIGWASEAYGQDQPLY